MPGKVKVKILAGRNLPVMDRSSDTTDAYVEVKLGNTTFKTDVCRKSLNPQWNTEWYRFEVDDSELQDEPLQIRLMDHDTYSANDAIGKVYLDLNPLLLLPVAGPHTAADSGPASNPGLTVGGNVMAGWIPVYDTMHGIRGEVNVIVKVELFSDFNKFRQSSCGVQFFCSGTIPQGYHAQVIHGFVEELVVNDDPEYQWIDKIRTPRASNEARQTLFFKLSGEVQRKIGLKALDLGGNAVIGYYQCFDLEGESGIVVRGIGTAVTLVKLQEVVAPMENMKTEEPITELDAEEEANESAAAMPLTPKMAAIPAIHRRSSDSDLSITPKGSSLTGTGSDRSSMGTHLRPLPPSVRPSMNQDSLDMLEYPFLTMTAYPPGFILHLGGCVSSRSVKLLERITNLDEPESRDIWWNELRMEVRSHARALGCNVVLGYSEQTSICDDLCVLSASGTAAVICLTGQGPDPSHLIPRSNHLTLQHKELMTTSLDRTDFERDKANKPPDIQIPVTPGVKVRPVSGDVMEVEPMPCVACHIPYSEASLPYKGSIVRCAVCKHGKVPDVLFTTVELLPSLPIVGKGCFIQAYTVKAKRDSHGEIAAIEISEALPFLEYELHQLLVNKLKVKGMNAVFKLKVQVSVGERLLVGLATGTAVFLTALPTPAVPTVTAGKSWGGEGRLADMQRTIQEAVRVNRELYQLGRGGGPEPAGGVSEGEEESEEDLPDLDLTVGNKDSCILEVDDAEDAEVVSLLLDPAAPPGFHVVTTETVPGLDAVEVVRNLQMFTQVWRAKIALSHNQQGQAQNPLPNAYSHHFQGMLQSVFFKLRRMSPCALCDLQFKVMLSEADEVQLSVYGMALGLGEPERPGSKLKKRPSMKRNEENDGMMFCLEEDQPLDNTAAFKARPYSPFRARTYSNSVPHHTAPSERYGVDLTPLSYVPGGKIERYLGNLNFFFIRESTSVREGGGLSGFIHSFLTEVLAIVRAHVTALGGNAMVAYFVSECVLYHNQHKNQGQCLINVGGDVVFVSYKG